MLPEILVQEDSTPQEQQQEPEATAVGKPEPEEESSALPVKKLNSIFSRRGSRFSDLVSLVTPQRPGLDLEAVKNTQNLRRFSYDVTQSKKGDYLDDEGLTGEEVKSFGSFVFCHSREKRFMEGLRRKAVPRQLFVASFTIGLAAGSVMGLVIGVMLRVLL